MGRGKPGGTNQATASNREAAMTRYYGNQKVQPGIYFAPKELSFKSMDE